MIIVDSSAALLALMDTRSARGVAARGQMAADGDWYAPATLSFEVLHRLRRICGSPDAAAAALAAAAAEIFMDWPLLSIDVRPLERRVWELRHNVTSADGFFVAAAENTGATLLTGDGRLAKASGPRCSFYVV